ncbi:MAG: FHA domain-containing serine/threonine-protein kinase [Elusimicrobiota bacterium]
MKPHLSPLGEGPLREPVRLREGLTTLGRGDAADVDIDDPQVSRQHCSIELREGELRLRDLGSSNGTRLNGKRIILAALKYGDTIELGKVRLRVELREAPPTDRPRPVGKVGPYELLERIGEGRSGVVYRARDPRSEEIVALKALRRELVGDAEALRRFKREMEALRRAEHPNVVRLLDAGSEGALVYAVMEFCAGETLAAVLRREGRLTVPYAVHIGVQLAGALECVRLRGVVHRDVKPANVLVDRRGGVKLADFGLAKPSAAEAGAPVTQAGCAMGTPFYMPPEQVLDGASADTRSDVHALAATLYHALAGRPPYGGDSVPAVLRAIREAPIPSVRTERPDCPESVDLALLKALAKDPAERWGTPGEFGAALERGLREMGPGVAFLH